MKSNRKKDVEVFFSLNTEDIQNVAREEIERGLTQLELDAIKRRAAANINWHDAISQAINETITQENNY